MRPLVNKTPIGMNEEFEDAITLYMQDLRKYCLSLTKTKWDGEDLMQDTLVKAYKSWQQKPRPIAKAYLFRIASNTWIDRHRKRKLDEDLNQDISKLKLDDTPVMDTMIYQALSVLLNEFSSKQRVVLLLVEGFGYTLKETAKMLSATEGSIKAVLHRARKKLTDSNNFSDNFYQDEESLPYVIALRNGNPDAVIRLYQEEINTPVMSSVNSKQHVSQMVQSFGADGTFYVVVSILMKNGEVLYVPFYQAELSAVLSQIAMFRKQEFSAVA